MSVFNAQAPECQIPGLNEIYERLFPGKADGYFVEVGAFDGYRYSNTWPLAEAGWRGLMFEPVTDFYLRCKERHVGHPGVEIINSAVGASSGRARLYTSGNPTINLETVETSAWGFTYDRGQYVEVPVCTLDDILPGHLAGCAWEVLVIDVEGAELEVLAGLDLDIWRPAMAIIETGKKHWIPSYRFHAAAIEDHMLGHGFTEIYCDHINSIYTRLC